MNDDYEEAPSILDEIITPSSPGDSQDEFVARIQEIVTTLAMMRSTSHQTLEYAFLGSSSVEEPFPSNASQSGVSITSVPSKAWKHPPAIHYLS